MCVPLLMVALIATALLALTSGANAYADGCAIVLKTPTDFEPAQGAEDGFKNCRQIEARSGNSYRR